MSSVINMSTFESINFPVSQLYAAYDMFKNTLPALSL